MIDATSIPTPSRFHVEPLQEVQQGDPDRSNTLHTRVPNPQVQPLGFTLQYELVHAAVLNAIDQHYRQHLHSIWQWTPPGASAAIHVRHTQQPEIDYRNGVHGSATVHLEQMMAHR